MEEWSALSIAFPGWSLTEIKELAPRERYNWLEMALSKELLRRL